MQFDAEVYIEFYIDTSILRSISLSEYPDDYEVIDEFIAMGNIYKSIEVRAKVMTDEQIKYITSTEIVNVLDKQD